MSMQSMMNRLVRKAVLSAFLATLFASPQTLSGTPGSVVRISWNESGFPGRQYTYPFRAGVNHFSSDNRYVVFHLMLPTLWTMKMEACQISLSTTCSWIRLR